MSRHSIGQGLHAVSRAEINQASTPWHDRRYVHADYAHFYGFWPEERTNNSLREALCDNCDYDSCESPCRFGLEAKRRVLAGEMEPCLGLVVKEAVS